MDMSLEDLHPYFPPAHGHSRPNSCSSRWFKSEDRDLEDSLVLGLEVNSESVWKFTKKKRLKVVGVRLMKQEIMNWYQVSD